MRDEDTGEAIQCPYCGSDGSEGDCEHVLAIIDRSFLECSGGYAIDRFKEFRQHIEKAFIDKLRIGAISSGRWKDDAIEELWEYAKDNYSEADGDWIEIDGDVLFRVIVELFEEAGGDEYPGLIDDGGGPGFSSAITLFHAQSPNVVFNRAVELLLGRLKSGSEIT
jgi:hypothetical protein